MLRCFHTNWSFWAKVFDTSLLGVYKTELSTRARLCDFHELFPRHISSGTLDTLARSHIPLEEAALDIFLSLPFVGHTTLSSTAKAINRI